MNQIPVYLSDEEAQQFLSFQKNRKLFECIDKEEALGLINSSIEIHFDKDGRVSSVHLHRKLAI